MSWSEKRTRKHQVIVALNDEEYADSKAFYERVKHFTEYKTYSKFARKVLTKGYVKQITFTFDPRELLSEVRRIGINVNQIAWKVNRENTAAKTDISDVQREVSALESEVMRLCHEFESVVRD
ncbi:hypothetical protein B9G54_04495 [Alloscardovia macacae]|uniref:Bacterial mobilisation domain-containing protein n=1 Tax=Alloscardovia macacae TaxID=1160091 RepID=A0A1Y2T1K7_9BIFI|nr:plasmid mobilization relaxosome protein MobC [Alloscardovia macacae]OTA26454.1 hypothetical protein B9G54_04495 [Alloscardovia macacae]OTA29866.1 hypothetical protein B9T39_01950 [Alloscardovia macacae]